MTVPETREPVYRRWTQPEPRAVFLLVHGLGAHTGRWEAMAEFFLKEGISSYAIELRDGSDPGGSAGRTERFRVFYRKILRLRELIAEENSGRKIFLVGESMGALVSFLLVAAHPGLFDALICISPAFASRVKLSLPASLRLIAARIFNPGKGFKLPFDSSMCTRDLEYRKKMDADSNERRESPSVLIFDILMAQIHAGFVKDRIGIPVLFLIPGDDRMIDSDAAKKIFKSLALSDKELIEYPGMYHALSIDIGKESVFADILKWITIILYRLRN